jgi:pimeloyl-ACP methyl ester carboxylesterase
MQAQAHAEATSFRVHLYPSVSLVKAISTSNAHNSAEINVDLLLTRSGYQRLGTSQAKEKRLRRYSRQSPVQRVDLQLAASVGRCREAAMSSVPASSDLLYFTERGSGPPLLLVHGFMVTGEMFKPVIEHFAVRHRVIVPDLRGHGRSRRLGPPYTGGRLARDLLCLLDHLGIDSTAVLGYSMVSGWKAAVAFDSRRSLADMKCPTLIS